MQLARIIIIPLGAPVDVAFNPAHISRIHAQASMIVGLALPIALEALGVTIARTRCDETISGHHDP